MMKTDQTTDPETAIDSPDVAGCAAMLCCSPEQRLMSLSENARSWLVKTCERFADNQSYDKNQEAIEECEKAGLIQKRRYYIEIPEDVFGLVYSEDFFGHND